LADLGLIPRAKIDIVRAFRWAAAKNSAPLLTCSSVPLLPDGKVMSGENCVKVVMGLAILCFAKGFANAIAATAPPAIKPLITCILEKLVSISLTLKRRLYNFDYRKINLRLGGLCNQYSQALAVLRRGVHICECAYTETNNPWVGGL
jgi:hypothetical protein